MELVQEDSINKMLDEALALQNSGKLQAAENIFLTVLRQNPQNFGALHQMGIIANDVGNYDLAIAYANEAMKTEPDNPLPINTLGLVFLNQKHFDKAIICFKKCISLDSTRPQPYQNIGVAYDKQKMFSEALSWYKKALLIDSQDGHSLNNIGTIYNRHGDFERAEKFYTAAMPLTNYDIEILYNIAKNLFLLYKFEELHDFIAETKSKQYLSEFQFAGLHIIDAIAYFIENNSSMVTTILKGLDGIAPAPAEALFPNYEELDVYFKYLDNLVLYRKNNQNPYEKEGDLKLFVIGESHSLSPAHTIVELGGIKYNCIPKFVMGSQARHFSLPGYNNYKAGVDFVIKDVPKGSVLLAMFGEIDCRIDYGILAYHKKISKTDEQSIDSTIADIVKGYVSYFVNLADKKECTIMFFGVPADNIDSQTKFSAEDKSLLRYTIKTFNRLLKEETESRNIAFLDIYGITATEKETASGKQHLDNHHLLPNMLSEAIKHLNK